MQWGQFLGKITVGIAALVLISTALGYGMQRGFAQENPTPIPPTLIIPTVINGLPPIRTATYTPSFTPRPTRTALPTQTATFTYTASATNSPTITPSATLTTTASPSLTPTPTASASNTASPTETATLPPSSTLSPTATYTASITFTPSITPSISVTPSLTQTASTTPSPSATNTETPTATLTATTTSTATPTATHTLTATATQTPSFTPTATFTLTPTLTFTPSITYTPSITPTRAPPIIQSTRPDDGNTNSGGISPLLLLSGGILTLIIGAYIVLFAVRTAAVERYAEGFPIDRCPVCEKGQLSLEQRVDRMLGIPRVRRTVRCDHCRSVLREVSRRKWRYAVDGTENAAMYAQYNNQTLSEAELAHLNIDSDPDAPSYIE